MNHLTQLAPWDCFVLYGIAPRRGKPGKWDKFPIDVTGDRLKGWQRGPWLTLADAWGTASLHGYGVGFVLPADLHLIDLDGVVEGCPVVAEILACFPGAFVERSLSGTGLHVIFRADGVDPHACRFRYLGIDVEFYSQGRFVALAGGCGGGAPLPDHGVAGRMLATAHPKDDIKTEPVMWADAPTPGRPRVDVEEIWRQLRNCSQGM